MNPDVIFEIILILLCMYYAYKWKQEKLMHEHFEFKYKDKCDLIQTYKQMLVMKAKQNTRVQNELNKADAMYHKLIKELKELKNNQ